ncbi:MAG: 23S rRNA (uracil(1939)-C(5))-methyltransferase RlmD, partial [Candidatus Ratteibacteria bacterium]
IEFVDKNNLEPYNPLTKKGFVRHLVMRHSKTTNQLMLIFITRSGPVTNLKKFVEELINAVPDIVSFWWVENDQISDVVNFGKKHLIFGKPYIEEKIENFKFVIYPEIFFQPNTVGASKLYETISLLSEEIKPNSVLGLFCGSAPIEIFLSRICNEVTGVDNNPVNIEAAKENCKINNITNCRFYDMSAEQFLKKTQSSSLRYDLLIVDPPRGGLSKKAIHQILKIGIKNVIYVSCNPATLARDIFLFGQAGYVLQTVVPIDLFPHTPHIESCCVLQLT